MAIRPRRMRDGQSEFHKRDAPMDEAIVAAIRRRLQAKITAMGGASSSGLGPGDSVEITNDEKRLGFPLPPLMKRIYVEIANGGFGPGYGLIGLTNGVPDDTGNTAPDIYGQLRGANRDDPNWRWPQALLPICHWGCAILSCVDCTDSSFRMRIFDPNVHKGDDWADCFFEQSNAFEIWMKQWASGADLWKAMYGEDGHIARILSTRHPVGRLVLPRLR
jgi:hypothetical protein